MEFLHSDNICGQTLLTLVARGSAIIAELQRISDHIPPVFLGNNAEAAKYASVLLDFRYLNNMDRFDEQLENDVDMNDLDDEFKENHMSMLERFYKLFNSIYGYISDYITYLEELSEGVFVQHTTEGVLMDTEGRQLMCEALYLYGVMLLLLEKRIPGTIREKIIVSYTRYTGASTVPNIDEVCKLCRSLGPATAKKGKKLLSPFDEYFSRFTIKKRLVEMIVSRLRSDDIYNHTASFPAPEHRSRALATQSAMLYVILYFAPQLLHKTTSTMREIVDKSFSDNWMVAFYMGYVVDLSVVWEPYKAAKKALDNIMNKDNVSEIVTYHHHAMPGLMKGLDEYLTEGVLTDEYVLENIRKIAAHIKNTNVTLRWFLLHRTTASKYKAQILGHVDVAALLELMMKLSDLEQKLKDQLLRLLDGKEGQWEMCKKEGSERMTELSQYFSGEMGLTRVKKNDNFVAWFTTLSDEIKLLDYNEPVVAGRKIQQLMLALEEVETFHQIDTSLQVKAFLAETRGFLEKMIRTVNVNERIVANIDIVSDFSYAWHVIQEYTSLIHNRIKQNPTLCLRLRATFLKLASILSFPLVRITECQSKDDVSVAEFYSSQLVAYVRKVLDVIPRSVFQVLSEITNLQTNALKKLPTKMERKYLKTMAQLNLRYELAKQTHQVSVYTEGILAMKTTLVGIIKLDPKDLLEDGIRKELVRQIAAAMQDYCVFKTGRIQDFENRITQLGVKLDGFRESFEYIQDYINVYGLKIWQQEISRVINYSVEQECNSFLKKKVYDHQSQYQSDNIPIPKFPPVAPVKGQEPSVNFMGRLVRELLDQTNPFRTTYVEARQGWYNYQAEEVIGMRSFSLLSRGVGMFGLTGIDRLICFMLVRDLNAFLKLYRRTWVKPVSTFINGLSGELKPTFQFPPNHQKLYMLASQKTSKLWGSFAECVLKIGQAQLVRRQIANELNFSCQMDSKIFFCSLGVMNHALITDVEAHYRRPDTKPYPAGDLLPDVSSYLEATGIADPITKIYVTAEPLEGLPCLMFLFVLSQVTKLAWSNKLNTLVTASVSKGGKGGGMDGTPFVVGVITIMKQFHSSHTHTFLGYLGQYVRANVSASSSKKEAELPSTVTKVLLFLEEYCKFSKMSRKAIEAIIPSYLFDRFSHTVSVKK